MIIFIRDKVMFFQKKNVGGLLAQVYYDFELYNLFYFMSNNLLFRVRKSRLLDQLYDPTTVKLYSKPVVHNPSHPAVHKVNILLVPP